MHDKGMIVSSFIDFIVIPYLLQIARDILLSGNFTCETSLVFFAAGLNGY